MKIRIIENHQLPRNKTYLFTDSEIKRMFEGISNICLFKSNHPFRFDKTYNTRAPKIKGASILTLAIDKTEISIYLHLYGCEKAVIEQIDPKDVTEFLLPGLNKWLIENLKLNEQWPKNRMILLEVGISSGELKFHYIGC